MARNMKGILMNKYKRNNEEKKWYQEKTIHPYSQLNHPNDKKTKFYQNRNIHTTTNTQEINAKH